MSWRSRTNLPSLEQYHLLLKQCTTLHQIHALITTTGLHTHHLSSLIRSLSLSTSPHLALPLLAATLRSAAPDSFALAFSLKACSLSHAHAAARAIHALALVTGNHSNPYVSSTQLHAYACCGDVSSARHLFDSIPSLGPVAWNSMITGYIQNALPAEALKLLSPMRSSGVEPTGVTVIAAISACARTKSLRLGWQIHGYVCKRSTGFAKDVNLGTALIDMYAKCGCFELARQVFVEMRRRDVGVWNALIGGCVCNGLFKEALQSFHELRSTGLTPDEVTLVCALQACGHSGMLDVGESIHLYMRGTYSRLSTALGTALMDMYSKCGCIEMSRQVFAKMPERDAMAWTSMISGLSIHGHARDALEVFSTMRKSGVKPDGVTFVGVLCACSHAGMVDEGLRHFQSMRKDYDIMPRIEHWGCVVDLLSRAGRLKESLELIVSMEMQANAVVWRSILSSCRWDLNLEVAEIVVENLLKLGSDHCGDYVLLSEMYALKGMWDDARRVRKKMEEGRIKKKPAFSSIESNN